MAYDSLSRVLEDSQTWANQAVHGTHTAFASHPITEFTFPSGRQLQNQYDALYRRTQVGEAGGDAITTWQFFGPSRVVESTLGNGLICTQLNNVRMRSAAVGQASSLPSWGDQSSDRLGYDGAARPITKRYLAGGVNGAMFGYNDPTCGLETGTQLVLRTESTRRRRL